jgi:hypothetical protein
MILGGHKGAVIAKAAKPPKQSRAKQTALDCFVATLLAMTIAAN